MNGSTTPEHLNLLIEILPQERQALARQILTHTYEGSAQALFEAQWQMMSTWYELF